jgi:hypothetical protein
MKTIKKHSLNKRFQATHRRVVLLYLMLLSCAGFSQVSSGYTFSYSTSPGHTAVSGGTVLGSNSVNDANYTVPIGFTFNYNGTDYTQVGVNSNGFLYFGSTAPAVNEYAPLSSASAMVGVVAGYAGNMAGRASGSKLWYVTTGTCPNRVFTVEWLNVKGGGGSSRLDLQISLYETSNVIDLHPYDQPYLVSDVINGQMGIRGTSNADYLNRMVSCSGGNWNPTSAGSSNTSTAEINGSACVSMYPPNTSRYRYTPNTSITTATWNGNASSDWFSAANWTPSAVPNSYNNISIPAGTPNYPVLTGSANVYCRNMTIAAAASLSSGAGYTGTLTITGNLVNNGTIVNSGSNYMVLNGSTGSTLGGSGSFTSADLSLSGPCANYTLANSVVIRKLAITANSTLSMNGFNLTVYTVLNQVGTINQSTGLLQIEDPLPTLTNATFNENTGTTLFAIGTNTSPGNQTVPSITYYNLSVNTNNGFTASIGNGSATTCSSLNVQNPGAAGGIAAVINVLAVNGNFNLAPTGNNLAMNLSANVSVTGTTTLYKGVISTGSNRIIISNSAAAAVIAGAGNTNYTLSYVNGNLRRLIANGITANYDFPLGDAVSSHYAILYDNGLTGGGFSMLDGSFGALVNHTDASMVATEPSEPGVSYTHICNEGVWFLDPDFQPTGGTYDIQAYVNSFAGLADDQFSILKRSSTSVTGADWDNGGVAATRPSSLLPGRTIASGFALRYGLSSFSQFGIATQTMVVLPVELISFSGKNAGRKHLLEWITATELNNDHFNLERSGDGLVFSSIGTLPGAGNSNSLLHYDFTDYEPLNGIAYYRLKQTDYNGQFKYSNTISLELRDDQLQILSAGQTEEGLEVTVNCSGSCVLEIELYDMQGKRIIFLPKTVAEAGKIRLLFGTLSTGLYVLRAKSGSETVAIKIRL